MRSGYSASRVLVSFLECLLLALIRAWILQLVIPCAGQGIPGLILTSQVIPLPVFLPSGVFQLSQFWRLIHRQALGSGNWWGCCGRPYESPLRFC